MNERDRLARRRERTRIHLPRSSTRSLDEPIASRTRGFNAAIAAAAINHNDFC
jgi:hypothetical protein